MTLNSTRRKIKFFPFQQFVEDYIETSKFLKHQRFSYTQTPDNFRDLSQDNYSEQQINQVFKYNSLIDFNSSLDKVLLFYGKPIIRNSYDQNPHIETLVYKNKLRGVKARCSLTFYKDKLQIYTYVIEKPSKKDFYKLNHYGFYKYGSKNLNSEEKIIDPNGNFLILKNSPDEISFNFFEKNVSQTTLFETHITNNTVLKSSEMALNCLL